MAWPLVPLAAALFLLAWRSEDWITISAAPPCSEHELRISVGLRLVHIDALLRPDPERPWEKPPPAVKQRIAWEELQVAGPGARIAANGLWH